MLNTAKTTNFVFKINGLDAKHSESIHAIDSKSKVQDRMKTIGDNDDNLEFRNVAKKEFEANLRKIDTVFPDFIAQMLTDFFLGKANKVTDFVKFLSENTKLNRQFDLSLSDYAWKVKNFLHSTALGRGPSKI